MTLQTELAKIRKKDFSHVYTLLGTESYLIETFKKELKENVSLDEADDLNIITFDMNEIELSEVIHEAETIPFFDDYKVIFVENPYFLTAEKKKSDLTHDTVALEAYLKNPLETTILVFVVSVEKMDERKKVVKLLKKESLVVDVSPMTEKTIIPYVGSYIENEGYSMDKQAFERMMYLTNMNLSQMMNELNKLFLYKVESKQITKNDIE